MITFGGTPPRSPSPRLRADKKVGSFRRGKHLHVQTPEEVDRFTQQASELNKLYRERLERELKDLMTNRQRIRNLQNQRFQRTEELLTDSIKAKEKEISQIPKNVMDVYDEIPEDIWDIYDRAIRTDKLVDPDAAALREPKTKEKLEKLNLEAKGPNSLKNAILDIKDLNQKLPEFSSKASGFLPIGNESVHLKHMNKAIGDIINKLTQLKNIVETETKMSSRVQREFLKAIDFVLTTIRNLKTEQQKKEFFRLLAAETKSTNKKTVNFFQQAVLIPLPADKAMRSHYIAGTEGSSHTKACDEMLQFEMVPHQEGIIPRKK